MYVSRGLEFVWRGSKSLGASVEMFAHVLDHHYCTPSSMSVCVCMSTPARSSLVALSLSCIDNLTRPVLLYP